MHQPLAGLYKTEGSNNYNAFEKDIAVVHFFFQVPKILLSFSEHSNSQEPTVFQFRRANRMTWIDFISQMGGLLGLFLGFSLISGDFLFVLISLLSFPQVLSLCTGSV